MSLGPSIRPFNCLKRVIFETLFLGFSLYFSSFSPFLFISLQVFSFLFVSLHVSLHVSLNVSLNVSLHVSIHLILKSTHLLDISWPCFHYQRSASDSAVKTASFPSSFHFATGSIIIIIIIQISFSFIQLLYKGRACLF